MCLFEAILVSRAPACVGEFIVGAGRLSRSEPGVVAGKM